MALTSTLPLQDEFRAYSSDQIPLVWDIYSPQIQKAIDRGSNYTLTQVFYGLCRKEMQLWTYGETALVTTIQTKKEKTFCLLLLLGGRMSDWLQYLPIVEDWARDQGAEEVRIYGRLAWKKLTGYDIDYCRMSKSLCPEDRIK